MNCVILCVLFLGGVESKKTLSSSSLSKILSDIQSSTVASSGDVAAMEDLMMEEASRHHQNLKAITDHRDSARTEENAKKDVLKQLWQTHAKAQRTIQKTSEQENELAQREKEAEELERQNQQLRKHLQIHATVDVDGTGQIHGDAASFNQHREWRDRHQRLHREVSDEHASFKKARSVDETIGTVVDEVHASKEYCSARFLGLRLRLNHLRNESLELSEQYNGAEETIKEANEEIGEATGKIATANAEFAKAEADSDAKHALADQELQNLRLELEELESIADNTRLTDTQVDDLKGESSLLDVSSSMGASLRLDKQKCMAFLQFAQRSTRAKTSQPVDEDACEKKLEELQGEFEDTVTALRSEIKNAETDKDQAAVQATTEKAEAKKAHTDKVTEATAVKHAAEESVRNAETMLTTLQEQRGILEDKIESAKAKLEQTDPDCKQFDDVSASLLKVRNLIFHLKDCPSAAGFKLTMPPLAESDIKEATSDDEVTCDEQKDKCQVEQGEKGYDCTDICSPLCAAKEKDEAGKVLPQYPSDAYRDEHPECSAYQDRVFSHECDAPC